MNSDTKEKILTPKNIPKPVLKLDPKPVPSSAGQRIVSRMKMPYKELSPYDVKNVYKNAAEINRAIKKGNFEIHKTQHMNWNNKNVFWLCYEEDEKIDETEMEIGPTIDK